MESSPEKPQPLRTVATAVKGWVERLGWVWVEGQLIQINRRSGARTIFLTLRDKLGEVSVSVTISSLALDAAGPITEGATVVARLRPTYWTPSGRLSFYCEEIRAVGEGMLLARLEQTKRMLQAEGLFDQRLKKPLPFLPSAIGLVTAADSAAERDVIENARRRWPAVPITTAHALVQGPQAVEQLITALRRLDNDPQVDVIIVARGGGSLEDLLPFSDEALVRAVHACRTPVVSAIGHEPDSPILDLVADRRASTPTDAAKVVVPDVTEERQRIEQAQQRLDRALDVRLRREYEALTALRSRPVMADPTATIDVHTDKISQLRDRAWRTMSHTITSLSATVEQLLARARAMSPRATLQRGYSLVLDGEGHAVNSVADLDPGDDLLMYVADGQVVVEVTDVRPSDHDHPSDHDQQGADR